MIAGVWADITSDSNKGNESDQNQIQASSRRVQLRFPSKGKDLRNTMGRLVCGLVVESKSN